MSRFRSRTTIDSKEDLYSLAQFYCSQRETSEFLLGRYLQRKCREFKIDQPDWIAWVVGECTKKNWVQNDRYARILIDDLKRRGKGKRYLEQKLKQKGLDSKSIPVENPDEEFRRAEELGLRAWRRLASDPKGPEKLMRKILSAGFSFIIAKKVCSKLKAMEPSDSEI